MRQVKIIDLEAARKQAEPGAITRPFVHVVCTSFVILFLGSYSFGMKEVVFVYFVCARVVKPTTVDSRAAKASRVCFNC